MFISGELHIEKVAELIIPGNIYWLSCTFSERCGLAEPSKIEKIQDIYTKALECYCNAKVKTGNRRFAKLIMKMIDLRTLNAIHSEMCLSLKIKTGNFPGILLEYFNIG